MKLELPHGRSVQFGSSLLVLSAQAVTYTDLNSLLLCFTNKAEHCDKSVHL